MTGTTKKRLIIVAFGVAVVLLGLAVLGPPADAVAPSDLDRIGDALEEIQREVTRIRRALETR